MKFESVEEFDEFMLAENRPSWIDLAEQIDSNFQSFNLDAETFVTGWVCCKLNINIALPRYVYKCAVEELY